MQVIRRLAVRQPIRYFASEHDPKDTIHKEEYLKIAREWPHEVFAPVNYDKEVTPEVTPEMLSLIATSHEEPEPESFGTKFWTRLLFGGVAGLALYRLNEHFTQDGKPHPFTEWIGGYLKDFDGYKVYNEERLSIPIRQQHANDQIILQNRPYFRSGPVNRWSFPDTFERASDFLIPVGSQIDVSDIKFKHTWERDDDLFGVPYPDKEK